MQPELRSLLESGLSSLGIATGTSRVDALVAYADLLERWNRVYNLTSVRDPMGIVQKHLLDSVALVPVLARHAPSESYALLDVGSGGGLPGVVIAIVAPHVQVTCVDAVEKKARFVQQVKAELKLDNLLSIHERVEHLPGPYDVITARAFATLGELVALTQHALTPKGIWLAMKGKKPEEEIAALPANVAVFHVEPLQVPGVDAARCVVAMREIRVTPGI